MIKSITIVNYLGDSIKLDLMSPEKSGFIITDISGLGPGKSTIGTTSIASSDGDLFNNARLDKRNITLSLEFMFNPTIEDTRLKSYKYFPLKRNLELFIETDTRTARISGYTESNEPTIFSKKEGCKISIICPDPYFYSTGEDGTNETVFSGITSEFEFPFENNSLTENLIEFGNIENLTERTIYYTGDEDTGVTIKIHAVGPANNIVIYNTGTRETMKINTDRLKEMIGSSIKAGDEITITTVKNHKSIMLLRDGVSSNILNCLDKGGDWFQLTKGDNVFTYTADYGATNLQFLIQNKVIFEGV